MRFLVKAFLTVEDTPYMSGKRLTVMKFVIKAFFSVEDTSYLSKKRYVQLLELIAFCVANQWQLR